MGDVKDRFFKLKVSQTFQREGSPFLACNDRKRSLALPSLAGTPKDKKYSSLSSKLELKGLVMPETASRTHSTLLLSRLNISFQCIEELFQYIEL